MRRFKMPMWPSRAVYSPIGLDLGARCAKAVQLVRQGDQPWRIHAATVVENRADEPATSTAALKRLWDVLERQGFVRRRVVLAAPAEKLEADVLELPPRAAGVPIEQIAHSELARLSRLEVGTFEMSTWDLPAPARASASASTHLMAVALRHADAEQVLDAMATEGAEVVALDVNAWALARAAAAAHPAGANPPTEGITAVLDIGQETALLVLLHEGLVVYQRRLAEAGTAAMRRALCARFNVEERFSELVLEGAADTHDNAVGADAELALGLRALVAKYVEGIVPDLEASFAYAAHHYATEVQKLLVVGGGARIPGLVGYLGRRLGAACQTVTPADVVPCPVELERKCRNPLLTGALGLALHGTAPGAGPATVARLAVNLIPAHRASRARSGKRRRAWAAACAAYTLALAATCAMTDLASGHDLPALRAELARVKDECSDWTQRHAAARGALDEASSRLRAARALTDHPHWNLLLRGIVPALGDQIVLRGVRIDTAAPIPPAAGAAADPATRSAGTYIVELRGYARSQPAVTQLPLKLEAMKLFSEVKLVRAQREPFLNADAVAFQVRCTLSEEVAP
jgi:Tfp pilus assembly PilM family ATPase